MPYQVRADGYVDPVSEVWASANGEVAGYPPLDEPGTGDGEEFGSEAPTDNEAPPDRNGLGR